MPCPVCNSTILKAVDCHVQYIEEPTEFSNNGVDHIHDTNPRVCIWVCPEGHEHQSTGVMPCFGCSLELANKRYENRIAALRTSTDRSNAIQRASV